MYELLSECCEAIPIGEVDESMLYGSSPLGLCSQCLDNCDFYEGEEVGEPFDTREEKYGER